MAVDLPAPEKPVMITRSVRAGAASCSSVTGARLSGLVTSVIPFDSDTPDKLDGRRGQGRYDRPVTRVGLTASIMCGALMAGGGVASAAPVRVSVGATPSRSAMPRGFVGVSLE